jgi:hypothetical protein
MLFTSIVLLRSNARSNDKSALRVATKCIVCLLPLVSAFSLVSCSQEESKPREGAEVQPSGDDAILPPANLAGAYLVQPKLSSCSSEKSLTELVGFCSYKLTATATGRKPLDASTKPTVLGSSKLGLAVDATTEAEAITAAQNSLITVGATFQADGKTQTAKTYYLFKFSDGKLFVYARAAAVGATSDELTAIEVQFGSSSVEFKKSFENPVASSDPPSETVAAFEAKLYDILRSLGVELVVVQSDPSQQLPESKTEIAGPTVSATKVLAQDILGFLALGRAAIEGAFK